MTPPPDPEATARPPRLERGYYLANFELLLGSVLHRDADLLAPAEQAFAREFAALSVAARRLYVRLLTRRGPLVRRDTLRYIEIEALDDAVAELTVEGFVDQGDGASCAAAPAGVRAGSATASRPETPAGATSAKAAELASCSGLAGEEAETPGGVADSLAPLVEHLALLRRAELIAVAERVARESGSRGWGRRGARPRLAELVASRRSDLIATLLAWAASKRSLSPTGAAGPVQHCLDLEGPDGSPRGDGGEADPRAVATLIHAVTAELVPAIRPLRLAEVELFRLLFFGNLRQDLSEFVLRDLGVVRFAAYPLTPGARPFPERAAALDVLAARRLARDVAVWLDSGEGAGEAAAEAAAVALARRQQESGWHPLARRHVDRVLNAVARRLERHERLVEALELFAAAQTPPARERRARILLRLGHLDRAGEVLAEMATAPRDEVEAEVAPRLLTALEQASDAVPSPAALPAGRRWRAAPLRPRGDRPRDERMRLPRPAEQEVGRGGGPAREGGGRDLFGLEDPCAVQHAVGRGSGAMMSAGLDAPSSVEERALAHLAAAGRPGFFAENWLWRSLFGLAFWDIVFGEAAGAFVHPFQYAPLDLEEPGFRARRAGAIADRLAALSAGDDFAEPLLTVWDRERGVANRLVTWDDRARPCLAVALARLEGWQLAAVCDRLALNLGRFALGLPDLFVCGAAAEGAAAEGARLLAGDRGDFVLLEVKGPGDQLRPEQRGWLRYLEEQRIPAGVLRVEWHDVDDPGAGASIRNRRGVRSSLGGADRGSRAEGD